MRVIVGRIGRPHGIRGELVIGVRTDEPDLRFAVGATLDANPTLDTLEGRPGPGGPGGPRGSGGKGFPPGSGGSRGVAPPGPAQATPLASPAPPAQLTVASARWHSGQLLVAFAGITDRTAAGELTGSWLSVDSSQLPETPGPDEFRDHELIGLSVWTTGGLQVGVVDDVLHYGQDLLVVRRPQDEECLVPFVQAIVPEVDLAGGVLVIDPPLGLLDPAQAEE
jgi:16S rRNA processing protein RimM